MTARFRLTAAVAAILSAALAVTALTLVGGDRTRTKSGSSSFLVNLLGPPQRSAPNVRKPARQVTVRIGHGYTVQRGGQSVTVSSTAAGRRWQQFAGGTARATSFGRETIAVTPTTTEDFLTVTRRQGERTWRWQLNSLNLEPRLMPDGSVAFAGGNVVAPMRIRPVSIQNTRGREITPAALRWSLAHRGGTWLLELRLDDSTLALPYVIDPAVDYGPSTSYETKTVSTILGGGATSTAPGQTYLLGTSAPILICVASATTTNTCPAVRDNTTTTGTQYSQVGNWNLVAPVAATWSTSAPGSPATGATANGGFLVDGPGASSTGTVIPPGTWTFDTWTKSGATVAGVSITLTMGVWVVTTSGSGASATISSVDQTLIAPDTANSADLTATTTETKRTITVNNVPQATLTSSQRLYVAFFMKKVTASSLRLANNVYLEINGTNLTVTTPSQIAHPTAADTTKPSTPTLSTFISPGSNWRTNSQTPTFQVSSYSDPDSDSGQINYRICSDNSANCTSVAGASVIANGAFSSGSQSSGATNVQGTPSGTALTNGMTSYVTAQAQDSHGAQSAWTTPQAFVYDSAAPNISLRTINSAGTAINLFYNENLATSTNPDPAAFAVTVNGSNDPVSSTSISGTMVTLNLQTPVHRLDTLTVAYTSESAGSTAQKVQDQASNLAADYAATAVSTTGITNVIPNTASSLSVPGANVVGGTQYVNTRTPTVSGTFSDPDPNDTGTVTFQLCNAAVGTPSASTCSGTTTLGSSFASSSGIANEAAGTAAVPGGTITSDGTFNFEAQNKDSANASSTNWSATNPFVVDTVAPTYASSATDAAGTHVDLTFTDATAGLNTSVVPAGSAFTVLVGGVARTVSSVTMTDATHIRLTLASRAYGEESVTVAYTQPGSGNKVQDKATNLLASFTAQTVTNTATADTTTSTVSGSPGTIFADSSGGSTSSTITVTLKNNASSNLGVSGGTVTMASSLGSLSAVTNVGNGTYTATLSSTTTGTATVHASLDGKQLSASTSVTVNAGALDHFTFTAASPQTNAAPFTGTNTLNAKDLNGNTISSFDASANNVTITANSPLTGTVSGLHGANVLYQAGDFSGGVADLTALGLTYTWL
jgi:uncharacterized repeat protein (TIGR02059 family)